MWRLDVDYFLGPAIFYVHWHARVLRAFLSRVKSKFVRPCANYQQAITCHPSRNAKPGPRRRNHVKMANPTPFITLCAPSLSLPLCLISKLTGSRRVRCSSLLTDSLTVIDSPQNSSQRWARRSLRPAKQSAKRKSRR